jgi:predicted RNA-binding Zn ribbon-like protein
VTARTAPAESIPEFVFVGGRPCLDLVDTVGKRGRVDFERLPDAERLGRWLREVGLFDDPSHDLPTATIEELDRFRQLREAVYGLVRAQFDHRAAEQADLDVVNREAASPDLVPQLRMDSAGESDSLTSSYRASALVDAVLSTLARDAIALLSGPLAERVKECEGADCTLVRQPREDRQVPGPRYAVAGCPAAESRSSSITCARSGRRAVPPRTT